MSEQPGNGPDMVDVTDSLEAASVFRAWKNFFVLILIVCMLLIQGIFWVTDLGLLADVAQADVTQAPPTETSKLQPGSAEAPASGLSQAMDGITPVHLERTLCLANGVAFVTAVLYCLTLMFSMMITIVSRLGGIRHISRAFFLSMLVLIFLIPWHAVFEGSALGVLFKLQDVVQSMAAKQEGLYATILYYGRFCGYWGVTLLMILISQARLGRWIRAMRRRLEII
ncbi:MAG: hypothetical protein GY809_17415 [Planctomycetes bacterium]|nr:hypothetical protein [Planctomycetota bacterium]